MQRSLEVNEAEEYMAAADDEWDALSSTMFTRVIKAQNNRYWPAAVGPTLAWEATKNILPPASF
ncbi:MAG: hypothetical protein ACLPKB_19825 [Xanthobacteraceae bacterium]